MSMNASEKLGAGPRRSIFAVARSGLHAGILMLLGNLQ